MQRAEFGERGVPNVKPPFSSLVEIECVTLPVQCVTICPVFWYAVFPGASLRRHDGLISSLAELGL